MCAFLFPCPVSLYTQGLRVRVCVHEIAGRWCVQRVDSRFEVKLRKASGVDVLLGGGTSGWFDMPMTLCCFFLIARLVDVD